MASLSAILPRASRAKPWAMRRRAAVSGGRGPEVEDLLGVDLAGGGAVGAAHLVGVDLEAGHAVGLGLVAEEEVAAGLVGVGVVGSLIDPDEAAEDRLRRAVERVLKSRSLVVCSAWCSWNVRWSNSLLASGTLAASMMLFAPGALRWLTCSLRAQVQPRLRRRLRTSASRSTTEVPRARERAGKVEVLGAEVVDARPVPRVEVEDTDGEPPCSRHRRSEGDRSR